MISETENDRFLKELGYDLIGEYGKAVKLAAFDRQEQVLDVATGSGRMAATLLQAGYSVVSGDIDPDAQEKALARLQDSGLVGVVFLTLDATSMSFDREFASIACANAIHHMSDPTAALSEMTRVCNPDGKLMIIEFNSHGLDVMEDLHQRKHNMQHSRGVLDEDGIEAQLRSGFSNVERHVLKLNNVWIASKKKQLTTNKRHAI